MKYCWTPLVQILLELYYNTLLKQYCYRYCNVVMLYHNIICYTFEPHWTVLIVCMWIYCIIAIMNILDWLILFLFFFRCTTKSECSDIKEGYWLPSVKNKCLSLEFKDHPLGFGYRLDADISSVNVYCIWESIKLNLIKTVLLYLSEFIFQRCEIYHVKTIIILLIIKYCHDDIINLTGIIEFGLFKYIEHLETLGCCYP